jgi:signal peptidase I
MDRIKHAIASIFDFLQGIVVVLALLVMVYLFIMSPQEVSGSSMEPNFHNGEYILTSKILYKFRLPERGDVVIFKSPANKEVDYIKRIIGLPGDTVSVKDNAYYVNNQKVDEPYLAPETPIFGGSYLAEGQTVTVPEGSYFVSGDNRAHSSDSREFGPIAESDFIGTAIFRYWPFSQMGTHPHPTYNIQ